MGYKVAVVGATGNVGREMMQVLAEREFPIDEIVALASSRSQGTEIGAALERQVSGLHDTPFTLADVQGRARGIRRRRASLAAAAGELGVVGVETGVDDVDVGVAAGVVGVVAAALALGRRLDGERSSRRGELLARAAVDDEPAHAAG